MDYPNFYAKGPTPCSQAKDPDAFSPDTDIPGYIKLQNDAKKICNGQTKENTEVCPYRADCLAWALFNNEPGVWGGTTSNERRKMKRKKAEKVSTYA